MDESLKQKTFSGLFWNFLETITLQGFGFIQGVILARQLMPSDYGLIAMTGIFFSMSYVLMDAGFTSSLIRSKDRTSLDYSTVFITNIVLSLIFCCILSLSSSLISDFYKEPMLK
jgi:O-antigen/teichoic acid export membrane protein